MRVSINRRLATLEAKIKPEKPENVWNGVPTMELIRVMTSEERSLLRECFLELPRLELNSAEYRRLATQMAACFDVALERYHAGVEPVRRYSSDYREAYRRSQVRPCDGQR